MPQVSLTLIFDSAEEAIEYLSRSAPPTTAGKPETVKDAVKPGKPAKTDVPVVSPPSAASPPPPAAAPAPSPTPAAADPAADYLKSGIPELIQKHVAKDRAAAIALLAKFGAKKGAELKPAQFADFKAEIEQALTPAEDLA